MSSGPGPSVLQVLIALGLALLQPAAPALLKCWAWGTDDGALSCPRGAHSLVCLLPTRLRLLEDRDRHTHLPPGAQCTRASTVAIGILYTVSTSAIELDSPLEHLYYD